MRCCKFRLSGGGGGDIRKQSKIHKLKCYEDFLPFLDSACHHLSQGLFENVVWLFGGSFKNAVCNSAYVASNVRMTGEWWIGKDLEGNSRGVFEDFFGDFPGETEHNQQKRQDSR
jgi:hypothetical protein